MKTPDLTHEQIAELEPIEAPGLYYMYNGEKRTPRRVYFSSDLRDWWEDPREYEGRLFTHFDNALRPVFGPDGQQFEKRGIGCVCASYKDGRICDFYKE